jgi:hypothetical protein
MKLIKIQTNLKKDDVDSLFDCLVFEQKKYLFDLVRNIDFVEYKESNQRTSSLFVIDDWSFNKISEFYQTCDIKFTSTDLTNDAFMDNYIETNYVDVYDCDVTKDIQDLIKKFKSNYTNVDVVLDKILEKGIDSLNEFDKSFLV